MGINRYVDPYIESVRCFLDLLETIDGEVERTAASLLRPGLIENLETLAGGSAKIEELYRVQSEVLLLPDLLGQSDSLSGNVVKRQVAATASALDRRIYFNLLSHSGEFLETEASRSLLLAALFWLNGTAVPDDLRNLSPALERELPEPFDSLRKSARDRLEGLDERSNDSLVGQQPLLVEALPAQRRRLRFLATQKNGAPLTPEGRRGLEEVLENMRRQNMLVGQDAKIEQSGHYPVFDLPENYSEIVAERLPDLLIEEDLFLFSQPNRGELRLKFLDAESDEHISGVSVSLHLPDDTRSRMTLSDSKGLAAFRVNQSHLPEYQVHVSPSHSHWSRLLTNSHLVLNKEITVPLTRHSNNAWWQSEAPIQRAPSQGEGVAIALIDTGISYHPDLSMAGGFCTPGLAQFRWDEDSQSDGHGTVCAGIINAQGVAEKGFSGLAPRASLWGVRATDDTNGRFRLSEIADGIRQAVDDRVDIINLSLGTPHHSVSLLNAVRYAIERGVLVVAAAGNLGQEVLYPARFTEVLGVGAYGLQDGYPEESLHKLQETERAYESRFIASFSCGGHGLDLCAPGVAMLSTLPDGNYGVRDGTSYAAPFVTGFAACLLGSKLREWQGVRGSERVEFLRHAILEACVPLGPLASRFQGMGRPTWSKSDFGN